MESNFVPRDIYHTALKILSDEPFTADKFGGLNREKVISEDHVEEALRAIPYASLLGKVKGVTVMQLYEHAKIEPGKLLSPERSQATLHIQTSTQDVFYEFERNPKGEIETRKLLYKHSAETNATDVHSSFSSREDSNNEIALYSSYEWVTTHPELLALEGLAAAILHHKHNI